MTSASATRNRHSDTKSVWTDDLSNRSTPYVFVNRAGQVLASGTGFTNVDTLTVATSRGLSTAVNTTTGLFTIPEDGVYSMGAVATFANNGSLGTYRQIVLDVSSPSLSNTRWSMPAQPAPVGNSTFASTTFVLPMKKNDTVQIQISQDSGSNVTVTTIACLTRLE
jgi:hypothetical protein